MSVLIVLPIAGYLVIQNSKVQTIITQRIATALSERLNAKISVGRVDIRFFRSLQLEDILIEDQNSDTLLFAQEISAKIDTLRFRKHFLNIGELSFKGNQLNLSRDSADCYNFSFILNAFADTAKTTGASWLFACKTFHFNTLQIRYSDKADNSFNDLLIDDLNLDVSDFKSQDDFTTFRIDQLKLASNQNIRFENMSAQVAISPQKIEVSNWSFESRSSQISNSALTLDLPSVIDSVRSPLKIDFQIPSSIINFRELGEIIPALSGMDQVVELSGQIFGDFNDLKGKNIQFSTGKNTRGDIDFYINDLLHPEHMYLFVDVKESTTTFNDLSNIRLPRSAKINYLQFPSGFYQAGLLQFKGNFSGFLDDFVTFGTLQSEVGKLTTDILVAPEKEGSIIYRGNIATSNFQLGKLFREETLGKLTFNGSVDGKYNQYDESMSGIFKGNIKTIEVNNYPFNDIQFDGILLDKMFDGLFVMNDSNLQFSFLGQVDLNSSIPEFDFTLQLNKARPAQLNLFKQFPNAELAFNMNANFKGTTLDNLDGIINIDEGYYKNRNGSFDLGGMSLRTNKKNGIDSLSFSSGLMDIAIAGSYHFRSIADAIQQTVHRFIPSYEIKDTGNGFANQFDFKVDIKDINPLANIFVPGLELDTPFLLYGKFDSSKKEIDLEGSIPGVRYNRILARDIFIGNKAIGNKYSSKFRFGEIRVDNDIQLYNFRIDSELANDELRNTISWSNYDELTYSGSIKSRTLFSKSDSTDNLKVVIEGQESKIFIADSVWNISPFSVTIDSSSMSVNNFLIYNRGQQIAVDGRTNEGRADLLNLRLKNINLADLSVYTKQDLEIKGLVNGTFGFANLFDKPAILSDLSIDDFYYRDQLMGDVSLVSHWNSSQSKIDSRLKVVRNNKLSLDAFGNYLPSSKQLNFDASFDSVSLIVLETFMGESFSNFKGYGSGKVNIGGSIDKVLLNGALMGINAGVTIVATQVLYTFNDSVYFKNDTILFDNLTVFDAQKNQGKFFGTIVHHNFGNMIYDLHATTNRIKALNTGPRDNEKFYGTAVARGRLDITGKGRSVRLSGSMTSLSGTEVNISMESESEVEKYDFIEFVVPNETEVPAFYQVKPEEEDKLNLSLSVEATSDAKVQLIYNSQIGDVIKAQGEGLLVFEMTEDGDIYLSGNYKPTRGDYLFTLQNVINKRFTIEPGGSIVWSGDPYNANIDLKAIYKLKASLYDLFMNNANNTAQNQRIQVECIIHLEDELSNPTIGFDIKFPNANERDKDDLQQFFNTEEELNKQILSLIVMGKFYTPEYLRGTYEAQNNNMLGTTASELFSNQLSNWLSQINDHWDVGVNYRPGTQVSDDEIELALSTQIFNDRVTLNGNIGNNANQYSTNNSQIVGDFEINVKLVPNGKVQLKAYSRSNNNLFYETAPYTQGIGLSFTEEYNTLNDLYQKFTSLFRKKK
ncbi:translocation/assembly module TamB domain-containing protein [Maribellus sp. YY47]|uniref:translocation/assembly module TamB domain-containing protein n=1 Tax=Maribellus sp. YY47 TaxID=2929486 RepID=UPI002001D416|nr:translocation/assembly module TamB domain-containing protein [Maribellus sp. YY47]MCK3684964.1 translocation/assembly module TamB [Maribellus sp. YY47]